MTTPKPPKGLTRRAGAFWKRVMAEYDLTAGQLELLGLACKELSTSEKCDNQIAADGLVVKDRFGQSQAHPLLTQGRLAKQTAHRIFKSLGLHELEE